MWESAHAEIAEYAEKNSYKTPTWDYYFRSLFVGFTQVKGYQWIMLLVRAVHDLSQIHREPPQPRSICDTNQGAPQK
jgi:hypothetical protein